MAFILVDVVRVFKCSGCLVVSFTSNGAHRGLPANSCGYFVVVWVHARLVLVKRYGTRVSGSWFFWLTGSMLVHRTVYR